MNQKEIDSWFQQKWAEDIIFFEMSLGSLYKAKEKLQEEEKEDILNLININISSTFGEILWLRRNL